jgi:hypothetical protein
MRSLECARTGLVPATQLEQVWRSGGKFKNQVAKSKETSNLKHQGLNMPPLRGFWFMSGAVLQICRAYGAGIPPTDTVEFLNLGLPPSAPTKRSQSGDKFKFGLGRG